MFQKIAHFLKVAKTVAKLKTCQNIGIKAQVQNIYIKLL
jgi:hypothetical protein